MADEVTQPVTEAPAQDAGLVAAPAVETPEVVAPSYDPTYVAQLEQAAQALYHENQKFTKYKDRIDRFETDPEFDSFYNESARFYEDGKKRRAPAEEAPSWFKPYAEAIDEFRSDRTSTVKQQQAAQQADMDRFYAEQRQYAHRLQAEHKLTPADVNELGAIADTLANQRGKRVGLEEAFRSVSRFGAGTMETPPPVLRGDAGVGGVPAPSATDMKANMKTADGRRATILSYIKEKS
jgi:hypothetical protein